MASRPRLRPDAYPETRTTDQHDIYFGTTVADPYRWLEDGNAQEVLDWTQRQHDVAHSILTSLPGRGEYAKRLAEVWDYPRTGQPIRRGGKLFYTRNDGLQPQAVLYVRDESGRERVLIDPNTFREDGTIALMDWTPSADGRRIAYALSESGEDWRTVRIRSVATGEDTDDVLTGIKFSPIVWTPDNRGVLYSRFPSDTSEEKTADHEESHELCVHRMGTDQADDHVLFRPSLKGVLIWPQITDDGRHLVVVIHGESFAANRLWYAPIDEWSIDTEESLTLGPLFNKLDATYECIGTREDELLIQTTLDAPHGRIVAVTPGRQATLSTVIEESSDVIVHATVACGQIIVTRLQDAHSVVSRCSLQGELLGHIELPAIGTTPGAGIHAHADDKSIFISFSSYLAPPTVLEHDLVTGNTAVFFGKTISEFDATHYETRIVRATSKDGTQVPVFVTARRGVPLDSSNPTILYGYGGFDVNVTPQYSNWLPAWLESGGVYAVAVLRGGGEYGHEWHHAGMLEQKQNVFDDFHAAARALFAESITSPDHLAIEGGSNGGLLVAATMLQHPTDYGAVLCHVPVTDMLRYKYFTAGRYWISEYGDAEKSEKYFRALIAYSPVHNVRDEERYPPILIMSADHDDRVVPFHSKKLAARLQTANPDGVVLLRIETKAGHGAGKPVTKQIELRSDVLAFLDETIGRGRDPQ